MTGKNKRHSFRFSCHNGRTSSILAELKPVIFQLYYLSIQTNNFNILTVFQTLIILNKNRYTKLSIHIIESYNENTIYNNGYRRF